MRVIRDGLKFCGDCMIVAVNGDCTFLDGTYGTGLDRYGRKVGPSADERQEAIFAGLDRFGAGLVPAFDSESGRGHDEFSRTPCACCGSTLGGERHEFAVLGPDALLVGDRVHWTDPDRDLCSGPGTVIAVAGDDPSDVIVVKKDDGGDLECPAHELRRLDTGRVDERAHYRAEVHS